MTTPIERARALSWAREFMEELCSAGELSEKRQQEALRILRHYPSPAEIENVDQVWVEKIPPVAKHISPVGGSASLERLTSPAVRLRDQ